jgi:ABC-type lipoprotein export system ATPase subunit
MTAPLVVLRGVSKSHGSGAGRVEALRRLDLEVSPGEVVALLGPSGSGKSSVLQLLCEWEVAEEGAISWGPDLAGVARGWHQLSVVPQGLGLLDELSVRENVELPGRLGSASVVGDVERVLSQLGLAALADRRPSETSLGEQQRAAVARAVVVAPRLLLADEPTSNQDALSAGLVLDALARCAAAGTGCLVATHAADVAERADRVVELRDGAVVR